MLKIKKFFELLINVQFTRFKEINTKIVVLDDEERFENEALLKNYLNQTYFIPTRIFAIKELFYNKIILKKTLKYFLRLNQKSLSPHVIIHIIFLKLQNYFTKNLNLLQFKDPLEMQL